MLNFIGSLWEADAEKTTSTAPNTTLLQFKPCHYTDLDMLDDRKKRNSCVSAEAGRKCDGQFHFQT